MNSSSQTADVLCRCKSLPALVTPDFLTSGSIMLLGWVLQVNPLTPNDLQRRRAMNPLKNKISSKNKRENQQIHQLFIHFINYVW
jgi:hypothetical protein